MDQLGGNKVLDAIEEQIEALLRELRELAGQRK